MKICVIFKDIFPGLSRTKVIFQDQGPAIFKKKNPKLSRTFQKAWEPCTTATDLV